MIRATKRHWTAAVLVVAGAFAMPVRGTETDQFLAWLVPLRDSAADFDAVLNDELEVLLEHWREKGRKPECSKIPQTLFRRLFPSMQHPRIRDLAIRGRNVERYPGTDVGYFAYLRSSIYRKPAFPFLMPMARTIEVRGIRMGTDKIGHMLGHGRKYYRRYLRARKRGASLEEAMARAVRWGVWTESTIVGGLTDGVFAHADLEANFQGMAFARRFCEGDEPYLVEREDGWHRARPLRLAEWVNPGFDETYNNSTFARYRWKRVRPILEREYCETFRHPEVQDRWLRYQEIDEPSLSRRLIRDEYQSRGKHLQAEQRIDSLCGERGTASLAGSVRPPDGRRP